MYEECAELHRYRLNPCCSKWSNVTIAPEPEPRKLRGNHERILLGWAYAYEFARTAPSQGGEPRRPLSALWVAALVVRRPLPPKLIGSS